MKKAEITTPSATNSLPYDGSPSRDLRRELWIWVPQDVGPTATLVSVSLAR